MSAPDRRSMDTTALIAAASRHDPQSPDDGEVQAYWDCIAELHQRGGEDEFLAAKALVMAAASRERQLGADILAQLGYGRATPFFDDSVTLLLAALHDSDANVVASAAYGLGHRRSPRAISPLLALLHHPCVEVRRGVVHGLSCHDERRATEGLRQLCGDADASVRDWASFGLAELCSLDYPELRQTLTGLLSDDNPEIRGQALIGLASRGDRSCIEALKTELVGSFNGIWAVQAAGHMAVPELVPSLLVCEGNILAEAQGDSFVDAIRRALSACRTSTPQEVY